jgi:hypothetical protein
MYKLATLILTALAFCAIAVHGQISATQIRDVQTQNFSRQFQYSSAVYYSTSSIVYINPSTTVVFLDAPSMVSTQLFFLPGTNRQKLIVVGENVANKLHIRNADATFYLGKRDRWEAEFYSNKWIETSRTDLEINYD